LFWGDGFYPEWNVILSGVYNVDNRGTSYWLQGTGFRKAGRAARLPGLKSETRASQGFRWLGYCSEAEVVAVSFQAAGFAGKLLVRVPAPADSVFFVGAADGDSGDGEGWMFGR
jgi:hypothetical protein